MTRSYFLYAVKINNSKTMRTALLRKLFLFLLLAGPYGTAFAQQNPDCSSCPGGTFPSMLGTTLTTSATHGACDQSIPHTLDVNRFGRMWGIAGNRYNISLCNNTANTVLYITTNTTIPGVITCDDNGCGIPAGPSSISFVPAATTTYRIYVFNTAFGTVYPAGTNMEVLITCISLTPPPNDNPCGAIPLPINGSNCVEVFGDNQAATNSGAAAPVGIGPIPPPSCTGALYQGADLWYSVQVPASGLIGIQSQEATICAGAFQLYTTTNCSSYTGFTALPNGCITSGLTSPTSQPATVFDAFDAGLGVGQTVYIRYWERNGNENGTYELCAFEAQRPINDNPCSAIALPLNTSCQPTQYIFENATPSTVTNPSCGGPTFNDVWFTFTVPNPLPGNWTGITVNSSPNAPVALGMAWYRLTTNPCAPANLTQIAGACNATGDINSANISPTLLNAGETIYVRVWGTQPWFGSYEICAVLNQAPANDDPCGAIPLALNYGCLMQTFANLSATVTGTNPPGTVANGVPNPTCGAPVQNDVWFTVTVPPNGVVQLDMLAGSMNDVAMAVYRVLSGSCATNNMLLQQIPAPQGCTMNGSQQGAGNTLMPYTSITGQVPGSTLYIRVWRQTGNDGTFSICARRTDNPPGNCYYVLTMGDTGGDGWGGSYVTICIGGVCNNYTVLGSQASISIGANVGQVFTVSYTAAGANQGQNSYMITQYGTPVYSTSAPPATGMVVNSTVSCNPPPAPSGDCMGAVTICGPGNVVPCSPYQPGSVSGEINPSNAACMAGEQMGRWMVIQFGASTIPCSPAAFDIVGGNQVGCGGGGNNIFDFVVWGPYPPGSTAGTICPITQLPYRCNWASLSTPTIKGLAFNNSLPYYQYGGGGNMARHMVVNPGDVFMIFVNNWSGSGQQFQLQWKTPPANFVPLASDCPIAGTPLPPPGSVASTGCEPLPIELLSFDAKAGAKHVDVLWSTATETGTSHYNVERSSDGENYSVIGRVDAAQFSTQTINYTFKDESPLSGLSYYRLQQVDLMENASHTHSVPVMFRSGTTLDVFPNPADQTIWITFDVEQESNMRWRIMDASGRLVSEKSILTTSGKNQFELPIDKLDQGSYLIEVVDNDGSSLGIQRFVKQ